MTAMGWIVVLGALGAYVLLWFAWWRALRNGPREWLGPACPPPPGHARVTGECRSARRRKTGADPGND